MEGITACNLKMNEIIIIEGRLLTVDLEARKTVIIQRISMNLYFMAMLSILCV